ncbi:Hypothetical predicted protein [Cloeon dipterum]|uniref:RING-type domain-containing protein n=1 Tax=Cloeon dipterum TaxID=197152 RepID=A0A8S1C9K9_9INSE|nr:Hypothetical predicted protein [Cloeon dipterum]
MPSIDSSGKNNLQCTLSSQVNYTLHSFWGVSIRELHLFLWRPWGAIQTAVRQKSLLSGYCQQQGITLQKGPHGDKTITMQLPSPDSLDLGTPPRLCYPLVIFLIRDDTETPHPDETVALINVVHIKDSVCTLPTSILAQYLKQANGQLSCLKPLYLANGNPLGYDDEPPSVFCEAGLNSEADKEAATPTAWGPTCTSQEQLCVVCQYFPLSRALLPCRHTCVCASCFGKLDRCPMCRSPIRSFFCIRKEDYLPVEARSSSDAKSVPLHRWLLQWNDRLTDFLGFH